VGKSDFATSGERLTFQSVLIDLVAHDFLENPAPVGCTSMTGNASVDTTEAEFQVSLINELSRLGAFVTPEFRIPGGRSLVDVYIASPVRAFVEIKISKSPTSSYVERLLQQLQYYRREFGGELAAVLVVGGEPRHSGLNTDIAGRPLMAHTGSAA
jgi:hypothetical protein